MAFDSPAPISRRTVAKGIAWTAPAVAIAGTAPAFAVSAPPPPPPPVFTWSKGCATVGNKTSGCANLAKTAQVPFTIKNNSGQTLQFQVLGTKSWNAQDPEPDNFSTPGGIYTNNGTENNCQPKVGETGCGGYVSVTLESGETKSLWLVGNELRAAAAFWMRVQYRWIQADPCGSVVGSVQVASDVIGPENNCS